jgi:hypothetical protein
MHKLGDLSKSWRPFKFSLHETLKILHVGNKWIVLRGLMSVVLGPSKRGGSKIKYYYHWLVEMFYCHGEDLNICCGPSTWSTLTLP